MKRLALILFASPIAASSLVLLFSLGACSQSDADGLGATEAAQSEGTAPLPIPPGRYRAFREPNKVFDLSLDGARKTFEMSTTGACEDPQRCPVILSRGSYVLAGPRTTFATAGGDWLDGRLELTDATTRATTRFGYRYNLPSAGGDVGIELLLYPGPASNGSLASGLNPTSNALLAQVAAIHAAYDSRGLGAGVEMKAKDLPEGSSAHEWAGDLTHQPDKQSVKVYDYTVGGARLYLVRLLRSDGSERAMFFDKNANGKIPRIETLLTVKERGVWLL